MHSTQPDSIVLRRTRPSLRKQNIRNICATFSSTHSSCRRQQIQIQLYSQPDSTCRDVSHRQTGLGLSFELLLVMIFFVVRREREKTESASRHKGDCHPSDVCVIVRSFDSSWGLARQQTINKMQINLSRSHPEAVKNSSKKSASTHIVDKWFKASHDAPIIVNWPS